MGGGGGGSGEGKGMLIASSLISVLYRNMFIYIVILYVSDYFVSISDNYFYFDVYIWRVFSVYD